MVYKIRATALILVVFLTPQSVPGQTPAPPAAKPAAVGLIKLTGDDEKRRDELGKAIDAAVEADRWDEAIAKAQDSVALDARALGPKHFETVDAEWFLKALRRIAQMPKEDRDAYRSANALQKQAMKLGEEGKHAEAQPLFEQMLAIRRRLLTDDHPITASSYSVVAAGLYPQGKYAEALTLYEKALELNRRLLTDDHPDTASSYTNLGNILHYLRNYRRAQPLLTKALELNRRLLTDDHPETARSQESLAENYYHEGKYQQAQPLFEKALETRRRVLGDDHADTAKSNSWLAINLDALGKFAEAQPLHEKALEIRRRLRPENQEATAASYTNLGYNLRAQGKFAAAQPFFEKALELNRRLFSDNHPSTARCYNNLAANLASQGKHAAAQPLFEKALEIDRRLLGDNDSATALCYNNLAYNFGAQGRYAAAQPLYEKALEIRRKLFRDDHPDSAASYGNLASNLQAQGRYAAAQPLYEKALEIYRRLLSDDHPDTAASYENLASSLHAQGRYAAAQPLYEKALEINRRVRSDDHPATAATYNSLALNLNAQGKYAAAQPLLEKALEIRRRGLGDDHPDTVMSYTSVAFNLQSQGKLAAAQPLFEKSLEIRRRISTDDHPETGTAYNNVGYNLNAQGQFAAAQPFYEKGLEIHRRLREDHPRTATSYNNVSINLQAQGRYAEAEPGFQKALSIQRRLRLDDHPETAETYFNLGHNLCAQGKYREAHEEWQKAAKSADAARLELAFAGLDRAAKQLGIREALAAVLARLGQPEEAWQQLEEYLGRGLLDELAARSDRRLSPAERARLLELTEKIERLDRVVETTPKGLDQAERAKRFGELKHERELAAIALGEFQSALMKEYSLAGQAAELQEIQAALPASTAFVAWVDIQPAGPNAADPSGEHWAVVVRSRGIPAWIALRGTGKDGQWTTDDTRLADRARRELRMPSGALAADLRSVLEGLRVQRVEPLAKALGATADGLPPVRSLIVLPSRALTGIPVEVLVAGADTRTISYAPSATVFRYLRNKPRPEGPAGLLALGDPAFAHFDPSRGPEPLPEKGLLLNVVVRGSNAANHGLKDGDVLLAYNGVALNKRDDLKVVAEGDKPIPIEVWRDGRSSRRELAPGKLGVILDTRPAPLALAAQRKLQHLLLTARSGDEAFAPLPGTRREVEAIAQLFKSVDRPVRALLGTDASEPELDRLAGSGELTRLGFIHLATHGVIDEATPERSAVILTQTNLPDPLEQVLHQKPAYDGRLSVREIQRGWELKAELVTLSACETALGRDAGGEGFVGFTQALLMSGARSVCLSLWKVDDTATALLMQRFYANLLGRRPGHPGAMPKADALRDAKAWLRELRRSDFLALTADLSGGVERGKGAEARRPAELFAAVPAGGDNDRPYASPHFWAAFVLSGDPD